jgi:hypothetical protein
MGSRADFEEGRFALLGEHAMLAQSLLVKSSRDWTQSSLEAVMSRNGVEADQAASR